MNKKQLKEIGDTIVCHCLSCEINKIYYGFQDTNHQHKCCNEPDYLFDYYQGVDKCDGCGKETVWFSKCYKCGKIICQEDCAEYHYIDIDDEFVYLCRKCHDQEEINDEKRRYKIQENYRIEKARIEEREKIMNELLKMDKKEIKDERVKEIVKVYRRINALFDFR